MTRQFPKNQKKVSQEKKETHFNLLDSKCPFYLGVSFFSLEEKDKKFSKNQEIFNGTSLISYVLSKQDFMKTLKNLKIHFQKEALSLKKVLFVFPLVLTKDSQWIVSKKTFFILPTGERKELSHLNYEEIQKLHKDIFKKQLYSPLKLEKLFSYLPNQNFLFYLEGSNREKIIKNLDKNLKEKTKGDLYLSSSNERLLREILSLSSSWQILYPFKTLVKFQMISAFNLSFFKALSGRGFIIPAFLPFSDQSLAFLKNQKQILFLEKDPPYDSSSQALIQKAQALISSKPKLALSIAKIKKPCLIKN